MVKSEATLIPKPLHRICFLFSSCKLRGSDVHPLQCRISQRCTLWCFYPLCWGIHRTLSSWPFIIFSSWIKGDFVVVDPFPFSVCLLKKFLILMLTLVGPLISLFFFKEIFISAITFFFSTALLNFQDVFFKKGVTCFYLSDALSETFNESFEKSFHFL